MNTNKTTPSSLFPIVVDSAFIPGHVIFRLERSTSDIAHAEAPIKGTCQDRAFLVLTRYAGVLLDLSRDKSASVFATGQGTATAFTGSAGPPIVSTFTRIEPRGLYGLVTRYANGGDQVLTTRTYHASQGNAFAPRASVAVSAGRQTRKLYF